jgi:hypothetical protein
MLPTLISVMNDRAAIGVNWFAAEAIASIADPDDEVAKAALRHAAASGDSSVSSAAERSLASLQQKCANHAH